MDKKKKQISSQLKKLRNKYIASIYDGLIKRKTIAEIHKEIRKITTIANNKGINYTKNMEKFALNLAQKSKKQLDKTIPTFELGGELDGAIALWVFDLFDKKKIFSKTNTISYQVATHYESDSKKELLKLEIDKNREFKNPKVFYLSSSHNDCAEDHLDYQGKIYIDEKWRDLVKIKEIKDEVQKYINIHHTKTFQWVIGKPVWLITRPNCRHYMKSLNTEDVLGHSVDDLIRSHNLNSKIGKEITRTIKHPTNKEWYKRENVVEIIKKYKERFEYHKSLCDVKKTEIIKRAIEKDKLLIEKWEKLLQSLKK